MSILSRQQLAIIVPLGVGADGDVVFVNSRSTEAAVAGLTIGHWLGTSAENPDAALFVCQQPKLREDLLPAVGDALGVFDEPPAHALRGGLSSRFYRLSRDALALLNGKRHTHDSRARLSLLLNKRAQARLMAGVDNIPFAIVDVSVRVYSTNQVQLTFLATVLGPADASPENTLTEFAFAFEHEVNAGRSHRSLRIDGEPPPLHPINALIDTLGSAQQGLHREPRRSITVAALVVEEIADPKQWCARLAYRHTKDYEVSAETTAGVRAPFANIYACEAAEGGAYLVVARRGRSFDLQFIETAFAHALLPLAQLVAHEHSVLVALSDRAEVPLIRTKDLVEAEVYRRRLTAVRDGLVRFRLNYSFSQVSSLSHQEAAYHGWKRALGVERLLGSLSADLDEASKQLEENLRNVRERRLRFLTWFGGAFSFFVASMQLWAIVRDTWFVHHQSGILADVELSESPAAVAEMRLWHSHEQLTAFLWIGASVVLAFGLASWLRNRASSGSDF